MSLLLSFNTLKKLMYIFLLCLILPTYAMQNEYRYLSALSSLFIKIIKFLPKFSLSFSNFFTKYKFRKKCEDKKKKFLTKIIEVYS